MGWIKYDTHNSSPEKKEDVLILTYILHLPEPEIFIAYWRHTAAKEKVWHKKYVWEDNLKFDLDGIWVLDDDYIRDSEVLYWMPIPPIPKDI